MIEVDRAHQMLEGPLSEQIAEALAILKDRDALVSMSQAAADSVAPTVANPSESIVVLLEFRREGSAQELLGAASQIAGQIAASVTAIQPDATDPIPSETLATWGADHIVNLQNSVVAEDVARFVVHWCPDPGPWGILAPSMSWGREVASSVAARLNAGLTGDAIELEVEDHKPVSWKPAFGGRLVAATRANSPTQMVTVRPGVLPRLIPRRASAPTVETHTIEPKSRFRVVEHQQNPPSIKGS